MSLTKSHGNVFLRDILSLYDVAESAFCDWITTTPVVPVLCVLLLLSVSSSLIGAAQEGLDLAFAAGTLSTTTCTAREDSARYRDRLSEDEAARALRDAKAGLKRALGMTNKLEKDKFKVVRQWLRYDDDIASNTVMFFERVRKDIKRSLKVTMDKIQHPGSLGARRKSTAMPQMYPALPTETEMTEEDKTLKWVNDTSNLRNQVKTISTSNTTEKKAQTEVSQNNRDTASGRHPGADTIRSAPPSYDGHQPEPATQSSTTNNTAPSMTQTDAVKKKQKREQLERRRVPDELWSYYLEKPDMWDPNDLNEEGLHNGIVAIFISPHNIVPWWVRDESMQQFLGLKLKTATLVQILEEIKEFSEEALPDDSQLAAERNLAQKRADRLQSSLITSCNDLTAITAIQVSCFNDRFYDNIALYLEKARKNTKAKDKVEKMKTQLSERGIVTQNTSVNSDHIKTQLPIFTGDSSLSILDAKQTWQGILKNAGVHRQVWGTIILERIKDPALSNMPLSTRRDGNYDEICSKLSLVYGGAIEVGQNIMRSHMKAGRIPDPSYSPEGALKVLRAHAETMEHAERFINLNKDPKAEAEIMSGANIKDILSLLPLRIRQQDKEFKTAAMDVEERKKQYLKIKNGSQRF